MKSKFVAQSIWVKILPLFLLGATSVWAADYGPPMIWVNGNLLSFDHNDGSDQYGDGNGHTATVNADGSMSGELPEGGGTWSGYYDPTQQFITSSGADVRAADGGNGYGGIIWNEAPDGMPSVFVLDWAQGFWWYLGKDGTVYHYGGGGPDERFTIDTAGNYQRGDTGDNGVYSDGVTWTVGNDIRAVSWLAAAPYGPPGWAPPAVKVDDVVWSFYGHWDGTVSFPGNAPAIGAYYAGPNAGQRLWLDGAGNANITTSGDIHEISDEAGTYSDGTFVISGYVVVPFYENGGPPPAPGPPMVLVNGMLFAPSSVAGDNSYRIYADNTGQTVKIDSNGSALGLDTDGTTELWSGFYYPSPVDPENSGVFEVTSNSAAPFDVRAYHDGASAYDRGEEPLPGHPAKVMINGVIWTCEGHLEAYEDLVNNISYPAVDVYLADQPGWRLFIDTEGVATCWTGITQASATTGFFSGNVFVVAGMDIRAYTSDNELQLPPPGTSPQWGPPAVWVNGVIWAWLGTIDGDGGIHADYYAGPNNGQILTVQNDGAVACSSPAASGAYVAPLFLVTGADIRALNAEGGLLAPTSNPSNNRPATLRIGGLHWRYLGSAGDVDYYAASETGQRLIIDASGLVTYSDLPSGVSGATGTYVVANDGTGTFTVSSGGTSFNAGTIASDLDILGNVLSMGSLADDPNIAGFTLTFMDEIAITATHPTPSDTIMFAGARPLTTWLWARSNVLNSGNTVTMMELDSSHRLKLFRTTDTTVPSIVLDPALGSVSTIRGKLRVKAGGDIEMGIYTTSPVGMTAP